MCFLKRVYSFSPNTNSSLTFYINMRYLSNAHICALCTIFFVFLDNVFLHAFHIEVDGKKE